MNQAAPGQLAEREKKDASVKMEREKREEKRREEKRRGREREGGREDLPGSSSV